MRCFSCSEEVFSFNGQELGISHHPNLFEIDEVDWNTKDEANITQLIKTLSQFKKETGYINDPLEIKVVGKNVLKIEYKQLNGKRKVTGLFNLGETTQAIETELKGKNVLTGKEVNDTVITIDEPIILSIMNRIFKPIQAMKSLDFLHFHSFSMFSDIIYIITKK